MSSEHTSALRRQNTFSGNMLPQDGFSIIAFVQFTNHNYEHGFRNNDVILSVKF